MTNKEKANACKPYFEGKKRNEIMGTTYQYCYHLITGEHMKRTCLNAIIAAHEKITKFIAAHAD